MSTRARQPASTRLTQSMPGCQRPVCNIRIARPLSLTVDGGATIVDVTSRNSGQGGLLSPFRLGLVSLSPAHAARGFMCASCVENAWQFSKVYPDMVGPDGEPSDAYWEWARAGWAGPATRYPRGRDVRPAFAWWNGERLSYLEARRRIYAPLYAAAARASPAFASLADTYAKCVREGRPLVLLDYDGWDHVGQRVALRDVLALEKPKMGHAFVLAGLLEGDRFWEPAPAPTAQP